MFDLDNYIELEVKQTKAMKPYVMIRFKNLIEHIAPVYFMDFNAAHDYFSKINIEELKKLAKVS